MRKTTMTKEERLEKQREYRKNNGNAYTTKYEKTPNGFLMRAYRNMLSRVTGVQKLKFHLYEGRSLLPKQEFYDWAMGSPEFKSLFSAYKASNFERKLCPSVDRVDSNQGYQIDNMEWVTHSENSRRGSISRHMKDKLNEDIAVRY